MRIIAKRTLREYWRQHADAKLALEEWHLLAEKANWQSPQDITDAVPNARYLGNGRFSFKIKGNRYRLVVKVIFEMKRIYIRFVGTHSEYDKIDATTI